MVGAEDAVRSFSNKSMDTVFTGLARGQKAGGLFRSIGLNLGESLIHGDVGMLTGGLFGKQGQAGGGLFGGRLNSLIGGLPHFATNTNDAPGGLSVVGEKGPELMRVPAGAKIIRNNALTSMRGLTKGHTFNVGGPTINVAGDVSEQNMAAIRQAVARGQQETVDHIIRNLPQIQADAQQY